MIGPIPGTLTLYSLYYNETRTHLGLGKLKPEDWERYGLRSWIEAAKKRLHRHVLAIALANKLARIAWAVLHKGRAFECVKTNAMASRAA